MFVLDVRVFPDLSASISAKNSYSGFDGEKKQTVSDYVSRADVEMCFCRLVV